MSAADRLARSRDYLIEHGKAEGAYTRTDGAVCALGALICLHGNHILWSAEISYLADAVRQTGWARSNITDHGVVTFYSDSHTESEVIDIYDRAIILAKEAETA